MTRDEYRKSQLSKIRASSTDAGKRSVENFVKALNIRLKHEVKFHGSHHLNIDNKYAFCAFFFYKWLAEVPEFDKNNTPLFNVPIIVIFRDHKGKVRFSHNSLGYNLGHQYYSELRIYKEMLRYTIRKMGRHLRFSRATLSKWAPEVRKRFREDKDE